MSIIRSDSDHLTLNAQGTSKSIKFQSAGVEKASITSSGLFTSTTIDATALTGDLPAISGANLTGINGLPSGGTVGQLVTNTASGTGTWQDAPGGGLPSGTKIAFFQASAPAGWTQDTTNNDAVLRVVSGSGGGTGGTAAVSSPAHSLSAGSHTLSTAEMPSHSHMIMSIYSGVHNVNSYVTVGGWNTGTVGKWTENTGGGTSHSHSLSGSITTPKYLDMIICTKD